MSNLAGATVRRPPVPDHLDQLPVPRLVLFDRDGTLVVDVPYNGDPDAVELVPGAVECLAALRSAGVAVGLVTNQSGIARGLLGPLDVRAVNDRVAELVGGFDTVQVCPHGSHARCGCRKPEPGMILAAAEELGTPLERCAMVGDIGSDVAAGLAAGVRTILVPTPVTEEEEIDAAPEVAHDLREAVHALLACSRLPGRRPGERTAGSTARLVRGGAR